MFMAGIWWPVSRVQTSLLLVGVLADASPVSIDSDPVVDAVDVFLSI